MTLTRITLSAAILLGVTSASFAMSPTGHKYRSFAGAYASTNIVPAPAAGSTLIPTQMELADRNSWFYRR